MTRSERLASQGLVGTIYHGELRVLPDCNALPDLSYIGTEEDLLFDGKEVCVDIYSTPDEIWFAVLDFTLRT